MKKQGKVKAIPVVNPKEGMQVIWGGLICEISHCESQNADWVSIKSNKFDHKPTPVNTLKQLVVEYDEDVFENGEKIGYDTKHLPLKYSQWQAAIDNGEVDSDKVVEFEVVEKVGKWGSADNISDTITQDITIAKIIPAKKGGKMYSEEEVGDILNDYRENVLRNGLADRINLKNWWKNKCK